ncbi:MAG: flagellar biosynthetic protein FliO [Lachnospiraceae bacterium]|nr:flagellar biosynthetic protein FliO [Lachnospiraceae bacterium]
MILSSMPRTDSFAQFLTVLLIFIGVLVVTLYTTRWIARYQKVQNVNRNIDVIETYRLTSGKYVQILRLGDTYVAVAICKDTVTLLAQIPKEQIEIHRDDGSVSVNFREFLEKARKMSSGKNNAAKKE